MLSIAIYILLFFFSKIVGLGGGEEIKRNNIYHLTEIDILTMEDNNVLKWQ